MEAGLRFRTYDWSAIRYAVILSALCSVITLGSADPTHAQSSCTILFSFGDSDTVGSPAGTLVQTNDGNLYGTASAGGAKGLGCLFELSKTGKLKILHSFSDGTTPNDGALPLSGLVLGSDGNFYGTTSSGGSTSSTTPPQKGQGTVFKMTSDASVTILHSFGDGSIARDGARPVSPLTVGSDGTLYGTTAAGGAIGNGAVFKVSTSGALTILHSFGDDSVSNDGALPASGLVLGTDGILYGTTREGGAAGHGTVFSMSTAGHVTILHSFDDGSVPDDGASPASTLVQGQDGNLYGTTMSGGTGGHGTVYKITPTGQLTVLASSSYISGLQGGLTIAPDGNIYGVSLAGGSANEGTVFEIDSLNRLAVLHSFQDGSVTSDGAVPKGALIYVSDGSLYGTTSQGGSKGAGSIFEISPAKPAPAQE